MEIATEKDELTSIHQDLMTLLKWLDHAMGITNVTPTEAKESPVLKFCIQQVQKGKAPLNGEASPSISSEDSLWDELSEGKERSMQTNNAEIEK